MYRRAADLDGDDGVERSDGRLEWLKAQVLVREDAELALADAERNAAGDGRLVGPEPGVPRGVLENVMQERIVPAEEGRVSGGGGGTARGTCRS